MAGFPRTAHRALRTFRLRLCDLGEHGWVFHCNLREGLAVERDVALLETADELAVASSKFAGGGADADLHHGTVVTLLEFATDVGLDACFGRSALGQCNLGLATPHHALGTGEDVLAALDAVGSAFDSWHILDELLNILDVGQIDAEVTTLVARGVAGFAAIEMVLAGFALEELAALGHFDAFGDGLVGFHRGE